MRLARLRHFAWMLLLVLSAGLAVPAFASMPDADASVPVSPRHHHADGTVHSHTPASPAALTLTACLAGSAKAPLHCPGCITAAECALSCCGVGVLPASFVMVGSTASWTWPPALFAEPTGSVPLGDVDPPRPVSVPEVRQQAGRNARRLPSHAAVNPLNGPSCAAVFAGVAGLRRRPPCPS